MTDLPEDPNRWPTDPFVVLNLDRTSDARTARRAYHRLARKYKPDKFPAEFQKVREAYEQVERILKWNMPSRPEKPDSGESPAEPQFEPAPSISSNRNDFNVEPFATHDLPPVSGGNGPDLIEQFQQSLAAGNIETAVALVNQIGASHGPAMMARANLTKYHLFRFLPDLIEPPSFDSNTGDAGEKTSRNQQRITWLLKSLASKELHQSGLTQLKIEFDNDPQLANCDLLNRFLSRSTDCQMLSKLCRLRWQAIGRFDVRIVIDDVNSLKPNSLEFREHGEGWVELLADSMHYTVWHSDERCIAHNRECWQEISESQQNWPADSVELLILAAEEWKTSRSMFEWSAAIPWARNSLPNTFRKIWMPIATTIASNPTKSLRKLNQLFQNCAIAMSLFEEGLRQLATLNRDSEANCEESTWAENRELVGCFFGTDPQTGYIANRARMLEFCILNKITPMSFARAANSFLASDAMVSWTDLVQKDGPILCVFHACQAVVD